MKSSTYILRRKIINKEIVLKLFGKRTFIFLRKCTGLPLGHILKTVNLPYCSLLRADSDRLLAPDEIKRVFASQGVDINKPIVASCFVGVCACTVAFGAYLCGKENVAIYDGSWDEFCKKAPAESYTTVP